MVLRLIFLLGFYSSSFAITPPPTSRILAPSTGSEAALLNTQELQKIAATLEAIRILMTRLVELGETSSEQAEYMTIEVRGIKSVLASLIGYGASLVESTETLASTAANYTPQYYKLFNDTQSNALEFAHNFTSEVLTEYQPERILGLLPRYAIPTFAAATFAALTVIMPFWLLYKCWHKGHAEKTKEKMALIDLATREYFPRKRKLRMPIGDDFYTRLAQSNEETDLERMRQVVIENWSAYRQLHPRISRNREQILNEFFAKIAANEEDTDIQASI